MKGRLSQNIHRARIKDTLEAGGGVGQLDTQSSTEAPEFMQKTAIKTAKLKYSHYFKAVLLFVAVVSSYRRIVVAFLFIVATSSRTGTEV